MEPQQQQQQPTSGASLSSALLFAASVSDTKRRSESVSDGVLKVARLEELRARLCPVRTSLVTPEAHVTISSQESLVGSLPLPPPLPQLLGRDQSSVDASSSALPQVPSSPSSFAPGHFTESTRLNDSSRPLSVSSPALSINGAALTPLIRLKVHLQIVLHCFLLMLLLLIQMAISVTAELAM